jgi:trigger factor
VTNLAPSDNLPARTLFDFFLDPLRRSQDGILEVPHGFAQERRTMSTDADLLPVDDVASNLPPVPEKLEQKVDISDVGPCKKHVKVTVDGAAIRTRFEEKYSELMLDSPALVPGFRPGKAPRKVVEKKFSKEIAKDVRTEVLMASLEQLADGDLLSPLSPPQLDPNSVVMPEDGGDMVYEFDIEVRPEFELPNYKGLKIRRPVYAITDADVAAEQRRMLEPLASVVDKGAGASLELNDIMQADLRLLNEGKVLNQVSDVSLKIEKRLALDDGVAEEFGKTMVGAKLGDVRTVEIAISEDVGNEALRGSRLQAEFTVKAVQKLQLPELTTDVLSRFNVRNVAQFDILARTRLERMQEYMQRQSARSQVYEQLAGQMQWQLPRDLLERQSRKTLARRLMEMRNSGMDEQQIARRQQTMAREALTTTQSALKEHFVLQKIAELEKLEIEDADLDAEIDAIADRTGETPRKTRARLQREDMMEVVATELLERKALDLVLTSAEYEDYDFNPFSQDDGGAATMTTSGEEPSANS